MSKFSHTPLGRDLPDQRRRDAPRMGPFSSNQPLSGFDRLGQGSGRLTSLMNLGPNSKMGPQGSRGMMPSGSSSQNLPSIFSLGNRGPPLPSQPSRDPDQASKILASFGLSSSDLDELSRYPEEKITAENLPQIIEHLKRRRAEDLSMIRRERLTRDTLRPSRDDWDDLRPFRRESFGDRSSSLNHVVDHDHGGRSRDLAYRERLDMDERLRDRERLRDDSFLDYDRMSYLPSSQERSMFEKPRRMPSSRSMDDFHGLSPKEYPHLCTLCDIPCNSIKNWNEHINGGYHRKQRMLLLDIFPELAEHGTSDPYMLQQSTNPAPGLLGPPPPAMRRGGGPDDRHGNFRGQLGYDDMSGPRQMPKKMGTGRVVHIMQFERGKNLRFQLLKLAKPFGTVSSCFILNKKNEAFIEMATPAEAHYMVDYYSNNTALCFGKPVQVHMSQKYKRIKKPEGKPEQKQDGKSEGKSDEKEEIGRVVHLSNLPKSGYTDSAVIKLAEDFGKVKTYILMRMRNQAFIEMESAEDAQTMIDTCVDSPLVFQGKTLKVGLSQRYTKLVLRIPNAAIEKQKEKSRKRTHSSDQEKGKPKQRKTDSSEASDADKSSQVVTTEDNDPATEETDLKDLVSASCEQAEETGDDEEATALLETSSSVGDGAEVSDINDLDQKEMSEIQEEAQEPLTSTPAVAGRKKNGQNFHGNMEDFVTLDEVGDVEDMESDKMKSAVSANTENEPAKAVINLEMASTSADESLTGVKSPPDAESATDGNLAAVNTEYELGPYQTNNPVGVDYVIPKTGFYCRLCSLFYTSEEVAKVTHCSSLAHYQKLKKLLNKTAKAAEKKN